MIKLCQRVLDGKEMPEDWKTSVMVPIYKGIGDVTNCRALRGVKLLEPGMKIVEKILKKRTRAMVEVNDMQFGCMPGRGTTDALTEKTARGIQGEGYKTVHMFCGFRKGL